MSTDAKPKASPKPKKFRLTRAVRDKRIALAKDVLSRIRSKIITPRSGSYFRANSYDSMDGRCYACAIGAAAVCALDPENKLKILPPNEINALFCDGARPSEIARRDGHPLRELFTLPELAVIESAFEARSRTSSSIEASAAGCKLDEGRIDRASKFRDSVRGGRASNGSKATMRAIFKSIIDHDGELVIGRA